MTYPQPKSETDEKKESFAEFLERAQMIGVELDITRDDDYDRLINFGPDDDAEAESDKK